MAVKVTVKPEGEAAAKISAPETIEIVDTAGRTISLKRPGVLAQFDLVEALGDTAKNEAYLGMVMPLIFVTAIDGVAVSTPNTKGELRALIKRLDEAGVTAVHAGVNANFAQGNQDEAVKKSGE